MVQILGISYGGKYHPTVIAGVLRDPSVLLNALIALVVSNLVL